MVLKLINKLKERGILGIFSKFSVVGAGVTLLSLVLLYLLIDIMKAPLILSYVVVYLSTIVLSYLINSKYVFKSEFDSSDLIKYFIVYLSGMLIGVGVLSIYKKYIDLPHWLLSYMVIPITFAWNFILSYKLLRNDK